METKFYLKNGKEVCLGNTLEITMKKHTDYGVVIVKQTVPVTKETLPQLLEQGVLTKKEGVSETGCDESSIRTKEDALVQHYLEKLAEKLGWKTEKVYNFMNRIHSIYPAAAMSILLREIAVELDTQYKDHINNSPEIYVISMFDGRITKANKAIIKNYKNFAAFRTLNDAKFACKVVRRFLKDMFSNERK